jgi:predicted nucleic acid-binding protein
LRILESLTDDQIAVRREVVYRLLESVEIVEPTRPILTRASQPMPAALGTLDAIHLATALVWGERTGESLILATHDSALGMAGRANGLRVVGL